jgi:hypothetical protein
MESNYPGHPTSSPAAHLVPSLPADAADLQQKLLAALALVAERTAERDRIKKELDELSLEILANLAGARICTAEKWSEGVVVNTRGAMKDLIGERDRYRETLEEIRDGLHEFSHAQAHPGCNCAGCAATRALGGKTPS